MCNQLCDLSLNLIEFGVERAYGFDIEFFESHQFTPQTNQIELFLYECPFQVFQFGS